MLPGILFGIFSVVDAPVNGSDKIQQFMTQTVQKTFFPQVQFLDKVLAVPVKVQRLVLWRCKWCRSRSSSTGSSLSLSRCRDTPWSSRPRRKLWFIRSCSPVARSSPSLSWRTNRFPAVSRKWPGSSPISAVAWSWLILLVLCSSRCVSFCCRQTQDARHLGRCGPEGQLCRAEDREDSTRAARRGATTGSWSRQCFTCLEVPQPSLGSCTLFSSCPS